MNMIQYVLLCQRASSKYMNLGNKALCCWLINANVDLISLTFLNIFSSEALSQIFKSPK